MIRNGYLLSLLTKEEISEYEKKVGLKELASVVRKNVDSDELFYLQAMRELIDACRQPFPERIEVFRQLDHDLGVLRNGESYPFVADQLLLVQIERTQRLQSVDRARCEAWRLALLLALGSEPAVGSNLNPLTGTVLQKTSPDLSAKFTTGRSTTTTIPPKIFLSAGRRIHGGSPSLIPKRFR